MPDDRDAAVRLRAFDFLTDQRRRFGEASIPRSVLERGFDFEGVRVPLIGPQGIFKPAILPELPLTISAHRRSSTASAPTTRGSSSPRHRPGPLRSGTAGLHPRDHPDTLRLCRGIDDQIGAPAAWQLNDPAALTARRQYVTAVVRQRLHQRGFRERVLRAYQAVLRHLPAPP